jgi:hypothetical protein
LGFFIKLILPAALWPLGLTQSLRPGTHYPHVTWTHVMLRVQLGYLTLNYGADSHFCQREHVSRQGLHVRSCDVSRVDRSVSLHHNSMLYIPTALVTSHELTWREVSVSPAFSRGYTILTSRFTFYFQLLPYFFPCVGSHMLISIIWWLRVI